MDCGQSTELARPPHDIGRASKIAAGPWRLGLVPFVCETGNSRWSLWETRSVRFPSSGGRVLGVHGCGSVHGRSSFRELGHLGGSASLGQRLERHP